jgi:hypothetical protein
LTLDDDIAKRLQAESRRTGRAFKTVVNEHLRAALTQRQAARSTPLFRLEACNLGGTVSGNSYDHISTLLDQVEGPQRR